MTTSFAPLLRLDRKTVLVALASLFLAVTLMRFAVGMYQEKVFDIEAKEAILFSQQKSSRKLPSLQKEKALLEREVKRTAAFLFHGPQVDTVTSTMQILLQSMITKAGLEPESLRPLGAQTHKGDLSTIAIKMRLNGSLDNFAEFLADLYGNEKFFLVENCTIKPDKKKGVKVFMDLKVFYSPDQKLVKAQAVSKRRIP